MQQKIYYFVHFMIGLEMGGSLGKIGEEILGY